MPESYMNHNRMIRLLVSLSPVVEDEEGLT